MQESLIVRYEFAPFNIGANLSNPKLRKMAIDKLTALGWVDICGVFDILEYESIATRTVGVYQKNNVWVFVPENGFLVARYAFDLSANQPLHVSIAESLLQRISLHKSVALTGTHKDCSVVEELGRELRSLLSKYTNKLCRIKENERLHEYVFSMFAIKGKINIDSIKHALLCPRDFGCSSSVPDCEMPTLNQVVKRIEDNNNQKCEVRKPYIPVMLRNQKLLMYSSWSSVVAQELEACQGIDLISLCEFRIQSIWLAGLYAQKFANDTNLSTLSIARYSILNIMQQNLKRLINQHELRLGPNASPDPSNIMLALTQSSEILKELKNADDALTYAINHGGYTLDERNATSRKMLEIFSLIFASSSLAPLLLPTPLNAQTINDNMTMFIAWLTLTLIGVYFVAKQR